VFKGKRNDAARKTNSPYLSSAGDIFFDDRGQKFGCPWEERSGDTKKQSIKYSASKFLNGIQIIGLKYCKVIY
jgi:hypothetical protein